MFPFRKRIKTEEPTPPRAPPPWVDTDLNLREVRVTPTQVEEFRSSRMWIHLVQACLHKRQKMLAAASDPALNERQSALALGFADGVQWALNLPGFVAAQPPRDESPERTKDEAALEQVLELKGLIHVRRST